MILLHLGTPDFLDFIIRAIFFSGFYYSCRRGKIIDKKKLTPKVHTINEGGEGKGLKRVTRKATKEMRRTILDNPPICSYHFSFLPDRGFIICAIRIKFNSPLSQTKGISMEGVQGR